jgi:hypothetical protein
LEIVSPAKTEEGDSRNRIASRLFEIFDIFIDGSFPEF